MSQLNYSEQARESMRAWVPDLTIREAAVVSEAFGFGISNDDNLSWTDHLVGVVYYVDFRNALHRKWKVDMDELLAKLRKLSDVQAFEIIERCGEFNWQAPHFSIPKALVEARLATAEELEAYYAEPVDITPADNALVPRETEPEPEPALPEPPEPEPETVLPVEYVPLGQRIKNWVLVKFRT